MRDSTPQTVYLRDYRKHSYKTENIVLIFELHPTQTKVTCISTVGYNHTGEDFVLDGHDMTLLSVRINNIPLEAKDYTLTETQLILHKDVLPIEDFALHIETEINPSDNTTLEGLYMSGGMYCTQCESEGFRKITYAIDRPDNMAFYTVKIIADDANMPILLSNGNLIEKGTTKEGRHYAIWHDPFKKPSYLFALVAGNLACHFDEFTTQSGRKVDLRIFVEHGNEDKCSYAMDALKRSMKWDEEVYGLEYDLDLFMIVAVSDFNFGAMENKGLNIFNSKYILSSATTATDTDYENIEGIVAHEYFHNWTGNRVTCRDWFQLCLKEGLTVFRDQSFSSDMRSQSTKRIDDVITLRNAQFPEDAGPLAHPARPESYIEINNFYTATVYEKGAEICRMLHTILGKEGFRRGIDLYFKRFDGMAVTVEDFVQAMSDATNINLKQFMLWYKQAGTPKLDIQGEYQEGDKTYKMTLCQKTEATAGQTEKVPLHIPILTAFIGIDGKPLETTYNGITAHEHLLELKTDSKTVLFKDVHKDAVPSVLRGFTAPVILTQNLNDADRLLLMASDTDSFNRYEAGQNIAQNIILGLYAGQDEQALSHLITPYKEALRKALHHSDDDPLFKSTMMGLPSVSYLMQFIPNVIPSKLYTVRRGLRNHIAEFLKEDMLDIYHKTKSTKAFDPSPSEATRRSLHNTALSYLVWADSEYETLAVEHYHTSDNMTDMMGSLSALSENGGENFDLLMNAFYNKFQSDALVIDKWFSLQARSPSQNVLEKVKLLTQHPDFTYKNPNRVRSLIGVFAHGNVVRFNEPSAYDFIIEEILKLDRLNPKTASRLATAFDRIHVLDNTLKNAARSSLEKILNVKDDISNDLYEIISKTLG